MSAKILDGRAAVLEIRREALESLNHLVSLEFVPSLAVVKVGDRPDSSAYTEQKEKACNDLGIHLRTHVLPDSARTRDVVKLTESLSVDKSVHGILIQLPLPAGIDENAVLEALSPEKDVEGVHALNVGRLCRGNPTVEPCTASAILRLLEHYGIEVAGRHAVVLGRSNIVGKPTALMLMKKDATVTVCHRRTDRLTETVREGDIVIVALGSPRFVGVDMIKPGAVVVDVGINTVAGETVGDVDYGPVAEKASWITPLRGGVGPVSIAVLMKNTAKVAGNFA